MSKSSSDDGGGVDAISWRRRDARKLFEESLRKVKRTTTGTTTSSGRVPHYDVMQRQSSELMHLLLATTTNKPPARSAGTAARAPVDAQVPDVCQNVVCSTAAPKQKVLEVSASGAGGSEGASVFTCDRLDEYLANDRMRDALMMAGEDAASCSRDDEHCADVEDLEDDAWRSGKTAAAKLHEGASSVSVNDAAERSRSEVSRRASEVEVDFIDGISFYSFATSDALLQHVDDSQTRRAAGPLADAAAAGGGPPRTRKFQYGIAGNMAKYLAKMKGWETRTSTAVCGQGPDDALDALLSDGMLRQLSDADATVIGLDLNSSTADDTLIDGQ